MPRIKYQDQKFNEGSLAIIAKANEICANYQSQGYDLTLRQLYYQFVSRAIIANKDTEYKRLGSIINDARLAGMLDWNFIVDRTRSLKENSHWQAPADIIRSAAMSFAVDKWSNQPKRVEVWIEKDALVGVIAQICGRLDVPYFSCRGYTSQSEMWSAGQRLLNYGRKGQEVVILHLGDHDPSGIDMSRDIEDRLRMFTGDGKLIRMSIHRIALTWDQIEQYRPPPNPAKITDSRAAGYIEKYGYESWELDALEPTVLSDLIDLHVKDNRDEDLWIAREDDEEHQKVVLNKCSAYWEKVEDLLDPMDAAE